MAKATIPKDKFPFSMMLKKLSPTTFIQRSHMGTLRISESKNLPGRSLCRRSLMPSSKVMMSALRREMARTAVKMLSSC